MMTKNRRFAVSLVCQNCRTEIYPNWGEDIETLKCPLGCHDITPTPEQKAKMKEHKRKRLLFDQFGGI
jgi:hypothetical protein